MTLNSIENQRPVRSPMGKEVVTSPRRQRIISESTGLVKFNLAQKIKEKDELVNDFAKLEMKAENNEELKSAHHKSGLKLNSTISPTRSPAGQVSTPSSPQRATKLGMINDNLMLELASKQREVLELKSNMDLLKKKLSQSEKELWEIEKKCNRSTASTLPPALSPRRSPSRNSASNSPASPIRQTTRPLAPSPRKLAPAVVVNNSNNDQHQHGIRSKPSLSTFRAHIEASIEATAKEQSNNFANLKKKISISQLNSNQASFNFKNLQKDITTNWSKSVNAFSNLKTDFMKEVNISTTTLSSHHGSTSGEQSDDQSDEYDEGDSDVSDYGCADASDYQIAVK